MHAGGFHQPKADGSDAGVNAENFHTAPLSYLIDSTIKPFPWQCFSGRGKTGWSNSNPFELVKKFLTSSQTRPASLGSRLKRLRLAAAHSLTLARLRAEKYFCRRTRCRQKCFSLYLRLRAQTLRGFFNRLKRVGAIPTRFKSLWKTYFCSDQMREE